jgi:hypothetical protein
MPLLPWLAGGAAIVAIVAGWMAFASPRLPVTNRLLLPVQLHVDGVGDWTLAPDSAIALKVPRGGLSLRWEAVRPMVGPYPVGERLNGSASLTKPSRGTRLTIGAAGVGFAWFAPLITNATGVPLRIVVNAGLEGAYDCACQVPSGAVRMPIGYYRLFANSTVEARDASGRVARFDNLAGGVEAPGNGVGLRFNPGDLRPPPLLPAPLPR